MQNRNHIMVERQENLPEGDIQRYLNIVRGAVNSNPKLFGGTEEYSVYTEVVTLTQVIVENYSDGTFFRADYSIDENDIVSFSNVVEVVRQYVEVDTVERSLVRIEVQNTSVFDGVIF